ncbi:acyltransferase-domain-containing protein [Lentithecium fluviatile CBS 122367]|uniref:Acyltransferase-domain-containing protein n=1 Tax=Lentithecium fluviatile CBS 122367 TaxID=1168545 RepID=A0A6G1ILA5_9PLEO|nr:acyltransferase-domain-containing protein [Lentithecium fluviatile CBS 122367]
MRHPAASAAASVQPISAQDKKAESKRLAEQPHPGGAIKHGTWVQALRAVSFFVYFIGNCIAITVTQIIGSPLYFYSRDLFYAWMAMTKQHFGVLCTTMTYWWAPVKMRVSGDESVRGQLRQTEDGRLECDFPERLVLISNHQIYTDWVYLWWIAYTSKMHGHLYIILKESIKYIPILGVGMQFYGFIFLSRKWATDRMRFQYRLRKLSTHHAGPMSGSSYLDPMWLLIFPEGTNLSSNGRESSKKWADKNSIPDLQHCMLPRSTGLMFCLSELEKTVDYMYDCTVAYEGVPRGQYGQDLYTIRSTYMQGRSPKSVNMHWRRFALSSIPMHDEKAFSDWLLARWREKDAFIEYYLQNGRFPADEGASPAVNGAKPVKGAGHIETEVRPTNMLEVLQMFALPASSLLVVNVVLKIAHFVLVVLRVR